MQGVHEATPTISLYPPGGHRTQEEEYEIAEYAPFSHFIQAELELAPEILLKVPGGHSVQAMEAEMRPEIKPYVPVLQSVQATLPVVSL